MDFLPIFEKMVELFLIIVIGYAATKANILNSTIKQGLSKVILNISLPCTALSSIMNADKLPGTTLILEALLISFLSYALLYALAKFTPWLLRLKGKERDAAEFGIMYGNVGFIGFPVTYAVFGAASQFYTCIFNIPFNLLCYSIGVSLIRGDDEPENHRSAGEQIKSFGKLLLTPAMLASIASLCMALTRYQGPALLGETFETLGSITTPGALLIIGITLAEMPFREMFNNPRTYLFTLMCVVVTPLLTYLIFSPFISDSLLLGETVILAAMPVATSGTMLCVEYGGDEKFMAQVTFLTTLSTIFTIPLIATIL